MSRFKRDNDIVESVKKIVDNLPESDAKTINKLLKRYESVTFKEYGDMNTFHGEYLSDMVNDFSFDDKVVAKKMANEHRTLQQSFMRLCMKFIIEMANQKYYDGRNERSVAIAKEIVEKIDNKHLPLI